MTELAPLLRDLTFLLVTAASVTLLFRQLKLPLVLGYLVAGILVGPFFPLVPTLTDTHNLEIWAEIGVIFLLFSLGLEFSYKRLIRVGKSAFITGLFEVTTVFCLSLALALAMKWPWVESLFFGGALAISSTSIIARSFAELNLNGKRFVSLVYGVLLVEDLLAVLLLVLLATLGASQSQTGWDFLHVILQFGFFLLLCFVLGMYLVPLLLQKVRRLLTDETLLILSVGLCLLMVFAATEAGFSAALGAFLMGSILAGTPDGPRIEEKMAPLRDLFSAIFFVSIGMLIDLHALWEHAGLVVGLSLFLITAKFLAVTTGSVLSGQNLRSSLQSGASLTQIGEFSFLMAKLGANLKVTSPTFFPLVVLVSALTSFTTPVLLRFLDPLVEGLLRLLPESLKNSIESHHQNQAPGQVHHGRWALAWQAYGVKTIINTVVILGMTLLIQDLVWPWVEPLWPLSARALRVASVVSCIALTLPFFWGILMAEPASARQLSPRDLEKLKRIQKRLSLLRLGWTLALLGFLVSRFLSPQASLAMLFAFFFALFLLRSRVEQAYARMETRFLDHLNEKEREQLAQVPELQNLAPWDAQLVQLKVSPNSSLIGLDYLNAGLRDRFGVTIALVERGRKKILAPGRDEHIYPGDQLSLIGSEEEIAKAREEIEGPLTAEAPEDLSRDFGLEFLVLDSHSPATGKSVRESGLRERVEGLIVGIERDGARLLNPDSHLILKPFDLLWIVGSREKIDRERRLIQAGRQEPRGASGV